MLRSYLLTSVRNFIKNPLSTGVSVICLCIGYFCFLSINAYLLRESSYDQFFTDHDKIYRVVTEEYINESLSRSYANTYEGIDEELPYSFPEIVQSTTFYPFSQDDIFIRIPGYSTDEYLTNFKGYMCDSSFLDVFDFEILDGSTEPLHQNKSVVITKRIADLHFGKDWATKKEASPVGKTLELNDGDQFSYNIAAVIQDVPKHSHLQFDILIRSPYDYESFWTGPLYYTYIKVSSAQTVTSWNAKLDPWLKSRYALKAQGNSSVVPKLKLQPLSEIHLNSSLEEELSENNTSLRLKMLLGMSIIIFLISFSNYTNQSIAKFLTSRKELEMRTVFGASKKQLFARYFTDVVVINFVCIFLSCAIVYLFLPQIQNFAPSTDFFSLGIKSFLLVLSSFLLGLALTGISLPFVLMMSSNNNRSKYSVKWLQNSVVVFQFVSSLILLTIVLVISNQSSYISGFDLGFKKENLLVVKSFNWTNESWSEEHGGFLVDKAYIDKSDQFKTELLRYPNIIGLTSISHVPGQIVTWGTELGLEGSENRFSFRCVGVGHDFLEVFNVDLLAGRDFSRQFPSDMGNENEGAVLINKAALRELELQEPTQVLGKRLTSDWGASYQIIGVIDSYHQTSLRDEVTPTYYRLKPRALPYFVIRTSEGSGTNERAQIEEIWNKLFPEYPYESFYLDSYIESQYHKEDEFRRATVFFAVTAVLMTALGLFAFAWYITSKKLREIAIRRVLGSSKNQAMGIMLKFFVKHILISFLIGIPIAIWLSSKWLEQFVFKIDLKISFVLVPLLMLLFVMIISISYHILKVSNTSPVAVIKNNNE